MLVAPCSWFNPMPGHHGRGKPDNIPPVASKFTGQFARADREERPPGHLPDEKDRILARIHRHRPPESWLREPHKYPNGCIDYGSQPGQRTLTTRISTPADTQLPTSSKSPCATTECLIHWTRVIRKQFVSTYNQL